MGKGEKKEEGGKEEGRKDVDLRLGGRSMAALDFAKSHSTSRRRKSEF